jgi:DNA repair protein RadC
MNRKRQPIHSLSINLALPLMREANPNANELRTPGDIYRELAPIISGLCKEAFVVLTVTTKYRLIDSHMISLGILDACLVHPREVFSPAIMDCAAAVILAHNHPSGDSTPSREDIKLTRQLIEVSRVMDIEILDHVIIGRPSDRNPQGFTSLRESGLVSFTAI